MSASEPDLQADPIARVTNLELFFDLVFVFTITQLTSLLAEALTWRSIWHVVVVLGLIFWMYDGYAWLTNAVPATGPRRRLLLLGGMAGYLVLATALPDAFHGTGLTFGLAYAVIVVIHAFLYVSQAGASSAAAMRALAPNNLAAALAVVVGGAIGGTTQEVVWTAVFIGLWFGSKASTGFEIGASHFVERHGLLVIVAIGESVVATGIGAKALTVDATLVVVVVLGLLVSAGLWWTYFDSDDDEVERAFAAASGPERVQMAFQGFGYAHYVMLIGVVLTAVGLKHTVAHPGSELSTAVASALGCGVALFLAANAWFRAILKLPADRWTRIAAVTVLVAVPVATGISAAAALAATTSVLAAAIALREIDVHRAAAPG